jgi:putative endonuclease
MLTSRQRIGKHGENLAAAYLEQHGMIIIERNFRAGHGEIDIVVRDGEVLVFVEVKTTRAQSFGEPEIWVDEKKQQQMSQTADAYFFKKGIEESDCRFDVVTVTITGGAPVIHHLPNAFWLDE